MDNVKLYLIMAVLALLISSFVFAGAGIIKLSIYPVFGDHMVLQRDMDIEISGLVTPGKSVSAGFAGMTATAKADSNGGWKVKFSPLPAGGPYELKVESGDEKIILTDILAGDVWFCSGQSNMEMTLHDTKDGLKELKDFRMQPQIRLFKQGQRSAPKPLKEAQGAWAACDKSNAAEFSAVGYFFGKKLAAELNVPIGLIDSSWGGTSIEIWTDANLIKSDKITAPIYERWKENPAIDWKAWNSGTGLDYELNIANVHFMSCKKKTEPVTVKLSNDGKGALGGAWEAWAKPGSAAFYTDVSDKTRGQIGRLSGKIMLGAWGGAGVFLKAGDDVDLSQFDTVEFDIKGKGKYSFSLAQKSITDFNYYTSQEFEAGNEWENYRYTFNSFNQGSWGEKMPFTPNAITKLQFNVISTTLEMPSSLYDGMLMPFTQAKIKGVIWYQGEANVDRAYQYRTLLPMMIKNWRAAWNIKDLPFYAVQLVNFMPRREQPSESAWAELREAQLKALTLPNTGVVSAIDLGEAQDIHPKLKKELSDRIAAAALGMTYGKDIIPMGPLYESMVKEGNKIIIKFKYADKGLLAKNGGLKGFSIAGEDKVFKWAKAEIKDNTVAVWSDEVNAPKAVRYAWADNPECNLYSEGGLAAFPFRTDDWKGLTEGKY